MSNDPRDKQGGGQGSGQSRGRGVAYPNPGGDAPTVFEFGRPGGQAPQPPQTPHAPPQPRMAPAAEPRGYAATGGVPHPGALADKIELGINPLVDAASALFELVVYLRRQASGVDIRLLYDKTMLLLEDFERRAADMRTDQKAIDICLYALAATIDDQVMSKPWGMESSWKDRTLVAGLFQERIGGERFFAYLDFAERDARRYQDTLELMYVCLSLGFAGTYRQMESGDWRGLEDRRQRAYETIRDLRYGFATELSPRWRGLDTTRPPLRALIPVWFVAVLSLVGLAVVFFISVDNVSVQSANAEIALTEMPPTVVRMQSLALISPEPPAPVVEERPSTRTEVLRGFLEPEIEEGLVEVLEQGGEARIRLIGDAMFGSGQAVLKPAYEAVLVRVAEALNDEPGTVRVEGHSDASPLRGALRRQFGSNLGLSEARAKAVTNFMTPYLLDQDRLFVQGFGATQLRDPANPKGGANRRVELVLVRDGG